jgi:flavin-dependent dehydrogenase
MPKRATKRGAQRTALGNQGYAAVVCGASFAGLAVTRELRSTRARVLVLDRYDIGERQTSACAAPTTWLRNLGLEGSIRQTFGSLVVHTPMAEARWPLPWTFSTFDYRELCAGLWAQRGGGAEFETATVTGRTGTVVHTDRGDVSAPLVVDALGWRRVLGAGANVQPPNARLSRGLEVHPSGSGTDLELWIDRDVIRAGYGWSFPAADEVRVGVGSFDPHDHVRKPTVRLAEDLRRDAVRYQGNWIPHRLRPAIEDGVFFCGDSAGHCLPLTAEGIRTALYFAIACGRELRAVLSGRSSVALALERYGAFSASHRARFESMLLAQRAVPHLHPRALAGLVRAFGRRRVSHWGFHHYLEIAPPEFALPAPPAALEPARAAA